MESIKDKGLKGSTSNMYGVDYGIRSTSIFKCLEFLKYKFPSNPEILLIIGMEAVQSCPR
jgi:hypothetical protein